MKRRKHSPYIHSMSEPFSEEDIEDEVLHKWLNHFCLQFHQLHASGHLDKEGIKHVVREISAEKVFPVHTQDPQAFKKISKNVVTEEKEKEYAV